METAAMLVTDGERPDLGGNFHHGDVNTFCPKLWDHLIDRFALRSMLDVGCGEGNAVHYFQKRGVLAHGIDGLRKNIDNAVVPIALHDLLQAPYIMPVDLVWSSEVAEHIDPAKVGNFIDTLANGRIVAMTHALPGQYGYHHVNCQPAQYWIDLMADKGFVLDRSQDVYRAIAGDEKYMTYFAQSGLVFVQA
jgi:SAM-dependent methyltransferase